MKPVFAALAAMIGWGAGASAEEASGTAVFSSNPAEHRAMTDGQDVTVDSDGGTNRYRIEQAPHTGKVALSQRGAGNAADVEQTDGQKNSVSIKQSGTGNRVSIKQSGSGNSVKIFQSTE